MALSLTHDSNDTAFCLKVIPLLSAILSNVTSNDTSSDTVHFLLTLLILLFCLMPNRSIPLPHSLRCFRIPKEAPCFKKSLCFKKLLKNNESNTLRNRANSKLHFEFSINFQESTFGPETDVFVLSAFQNKRIILTIFTPYWSIH